MGVLISDKFTFHHPAFQFQHSDGSCLGEDKTHYQCLAFLRWSHDVVFLILTGQLDKSQDITVKRQGKLKWHKKTRETNGPPG